MSPVNDSYKKKVFVYVKFHESGHKNSISKNMHFQLMHIEEFLRISATSKLIEILHAIQNVYVDNEKLISNPQNNLSFTTNCGKRGWRERQKIKQEMDYCFSAVDIDGPCDGKKVLQNLRLGYRENEGRERENKIGNGMLFLRH